jgi:hypothetical protein
MTREEELREVKLEIARLEHELRLEEIEAKKQADLELEEKRAQHALILEEQRGKNSLAVENKKGLWALGAAIGGCLLGVGLTIWANNRGVSQRDISQGTGSRRLLK